MQEYVLFFDIDNCLYPQSYKIHKIMGKLIDEYFHNHLQLTWDEAVGLHNRYYKDYGLALVGLLKHHKIDALEYNSKVDDALPLEDIIKPNPSLRKLLEDIDKTKVKLWLFTNAYVNHGRRVVKLLGIDDLFEGITYCDYEAEELICKPKIEMFEKAMLQSGATDKSKCFFVDDSALNCKGGTEFGWTVAHKLETPGSPLATTNSNIDTNNSNFPPRLSQSGINHHPDLDPMESSLITKSTTTPNSVASINAGTGLDTVSKYAIHDLEELRTIFSQLFKSTSLA